MSSAAELSKDFKVLLLEKKTPGDTQATWYSYEDRAIQYELEDAIKVRTNYIKFTAPTVEHYMKDNCVVLDSNKVLEIWMERAQNNGALIKQEAFLDYRDQEDHIVVKTNSGHYKASLLIDCMGIHSTILERKNLVKCKDAWVIYGAKLSNIRLKNSSQLEYLPLNDEENTYIGIHPQNETESHIYAFKGQKNTFGNPEELKVRFNEYIAEFQPNAEQNTILKGTIVSGTLKKYALNNIIFFGASGMLNPDGCGMGFNEILMKHRKFATGIKELLTTKSLDAKSLQKIANSLKDQETINFQKIIGAFSLYFIQSKGKWDGGVKWLNAMGEDSKYWMRNEMTLEWIKRANLRLNGVIPFKETFKMIPLNEFFFIIGQYIRFKIKSIKSDFRSTG